MGLYSITHKGRERVWVGLLADFQNDKRIWQVYDVMVPTDAPGSSYRGDGVSTFSQLNTGGSVKRPNATALNTTAAATSVALQAAIAAGLITSTSAAAVTLTLPTAVQLAAKFKGVRGVSVEFTVDNSAGASTITVAVSTGVVVGTAVITGSDSLTILSGKVGVFKLYFTSATAVLLSRIL